MNGSFVLNYMEIHCFLAVLCLIICMAVLRYVCSGFGSYSSFDSSAICMAIF